MSLSKLVNVSKITSSKLKLFNQTAIGSSQQNVPIHSEALLNHQTAQLNNIYSSISPMKIISMKNFWHSP